MLRENKDKAPDLLTKYLEGCDFASIYDTFATNEQLPKKRRNYVKLKKAW